MVWKEVFPQASVSMSVWSSFLHTDREIFLTTGGVASHEICKAYGEEDDGRFLGFAPIWQLVFYVTAFD